MLEKEIFQRYMVQYDLLISYGFHLENDIYIYTQNILDNSFEVTISISKSGEINLRVFDYDSEDEYFGYRSTQAGEFAGKVRSCLEDILIDIRNKCYVRHYFLSNQANRIAYEIEKIYGDKPSFEWDSNPGYGVFKNSNSKKWYGIIMNVDRDKLHAGTSVFEIINVKLDPSKISSLLEKNGYYPAYHMNKKYWISISLDDTLEDNEILSFIKESHSFTEDFSKRVNHEWIIPANPKYYDVEEGFLNHNDILTWNRNSRIEKGDIVYIYMASPISAIEYQCKVIEVYGDLMKLQRIKTYDRSVCSFSKMKELGIRSVRGARYMSQEVKDYLLKLE